MLYEVVLVSANKVNQLSHRGTLLSYRGGLGGLPGEVWLFLRNFSPVFRASEECIFQTPAAAAAAAAKSLQSCPTLCNPIDGSLPGSPVPGILQARTLEWVAISFSNA